MRLPGFLWLLLAATPLLDAGANPKPKASEYPAHAALAKLALGAEYLVRSFSGRQQTFATQDHLVVEVAVYPSPGEKLALSHGHFSLRLNGNKQVLAPVSAGFVAASLKYPDWERRPRLEGIAGAGDRGVILGRPVPTERFPGDPSGRSRLPAPPQAPESDPRGGYERPPQVRPEDILVEFELPSGDLSGPVAGYLYFYYKGKTKPIRSVELLYQGPAGAATLKLQ